MAHGSFSRDENKNNVNFFETYILFFVVCSFFTSCRGSLIKMNQVVEQHGECWGQRAREEIVSSSSYDIFRLLFFCLILVFIINSPTTRTHNVPPLSACRLIIRPLIISSLLICALLLFHTKIEIH